MKATACYIRVSTLDQDKGLKSQERALRDYCDNHGLRDVKWYRDILTGATTVRPAFARLQRDIFAGGVHTVISDNHSYRSTTIRITGGG